MTPGKAQNWKIGLLSLMKRQVSTRSCIDHAGVWHENNVRRSYKTKQKKGNTISRQIVRNTIYSTKRFLNNAEIEAIYMETRLILWYVSRALACCGVSRDAVVRTQNGVLFIHKLTTALSSETCCRHRHKCRAICLCVFLLGKSDIVFG